ncbi:MAG TPA: rhomboid family intramembrane serine protease, partial [Verrucomicrobiae bacterium]|nr:rhomboid family intramembrane serine protease [Verrucomicrobiae bacterium]
MHNTIATRPKPDIVPSIDIKRIQSVTPTAETNTARIPARSRRQAMDWSLVLASQSIDTVVDWSEESGWGLIVAAPDREKALYSIQQFRAENRHWPWRQKVFRQQVLFDWGSLAWVGLISAFYWLSVTGANLRTAGLMDSVAVSHGQWWRLVTAIFLHADLGHLASNGGIGFILLGLAMGRYGTGVGLLAALLAGVGGNVTTWFIDKNHLSLGASGMVMGALGLLAAQSFTGWRKNP